MADAKAAHMDHVYHIHCGCSSLGLQLELMLLKRIRLSVLMVLYFHSLKKIFLHGHQDPLPYTSFFAPIIIYIPCSIPTTRVEPARQVLFLCLTSRALPPSLPHSLSLPWPPSLHRLTPSLASLASEPQAAPLLPYIPCRRAAGLVAELPPWIRAPHRAGLRRGRACAISRAPRPHRCRASSRPPQ